MAKKYIIVKGEIHDQFMQSRSKVQFIGGGFGNGKTAAGCVKALRIAQAYPGSNGLVARSTYPKLNDSTRREFLLWTPKEWIKRKPTRDDNTLELVNGSVINFRYVQQQGTKSEQSSSNLLSATYDWIFVDQLEDPEFQHKDFLDLLGRLRGNTECISDDPTMPRTGPRWLIVTANPSRNWVYREIVRPIHRFRDPHNPVIDPKLIVDVDINGKPIIKDGKPIPIVELFEASTLANAHNVGDDYIRTMLASYTGTMRDRFIYGKWGALSGLIYPQFDETMHVIEDETIKRYLYELRRSGFRPTWIEGYDHGLIVPSCYLLAFVDDEGNIFVVDGMYEKEQPINTTADKIKDIRQNWKIDKETDKTNIYADPDLFRRKPVNGIIVGATVADLYEEHNISMQRGDANVAAGIAKVGQYLSVMPRHEHPIMGHAPAPHIYFNNKLDFVINEFSEYYWKSDTTGERADTPNDKNDHAMDTLKYMLTDQVKLAKYVGRENAKKSFLFWHEVERNNAITLPRHK